jgi:hypothetical protein
MQVGDIVQKIVGYNIDLDSDNHGKPQLDTSMSGVVFKVEIGENYERSIIEAVEVRWFDGSLGRYAKDRENEIDTTDLLEVVSPKLFVNVYLYDRAYGGPAEGGDWYDTYDPERSTQCDSEQAAEALKVTEQAWCDEQNAERNSDVNSVASEGKYIVYMEPWPAQPSPVGPYVYS